MIWDFWARYYDRLWVQKVSLGPTRNCVKKILKKNSINSGNILDMGCGTGQLLREISQEFNFDLHIGIDFSLEMIAKANKNILNSNLKEQEKSLQENKKSEDKYIKLASKETKNFKEINIDLHTQEDKRSKYTDYIIKSENNKNFKFICSDVNELDTLSLPKCKAVICTHSLPYYKNQSKAISDMADILEKDGILIVACGSMNTIWDTIALSFIKITTGLAHYPSIKKLRKMSGKKLEVINIYKIKAKWYMPSIIAIAYRRI